MTFAEQLKTVRREKRLTVAAAVAMIPKLSPTEYQLWEMGTRVPPEWAQYQVLMQLGGKP